MKQRILAKAYIVTLFCDLENCGGECLHNGLMNDLGEFEHECLHCANLTTENKAFPCTEFQAVK